MDLLEQVITEKPRFHASETEISRPFDARESYLSESSARNLAAGSLVCYGIGEDVLRFLARSIGPSTRTLETGAGCSTLIFALKGARHTVVTPSPEEIERIRAYAGGKAISLDTVQFIAKASEEYLPFADATSLDLVLLDGKHAFPWPMVDFFFIADRLKRDGLLLLDDAAMRSVSILVDFLSVDPGWKKLENFADKTIVFMKTKEKVLDVAWHMQPWTVGSTGKSVPDDLVSRLWRKIGRMIGAK